MNAGLFTYAWDLDAEGFETAIGRIADAGFTEINLATSYHAGKFLLPHSPKRRVVFPEDGAIYFRPDMSRYGRIKPRVHSLAQQERDPVERLLEAIRPHGLTYTAWTVCLHNSWLGAQYPDTTTQTAFGDPLVHSLNPAHPDVRQYLVAMIGDLVSRYEVDAIQLESPGYMGFTHGYHHEIVGTPWDPMQEALMSVSFHPAEIAAATKTGIDAEGVRRRVADLLDACWNRGVAVMEDGAPSAGVQALFDDDDYTAYRAWQTDQVISLSAEIREVVKKANQETQIRHFAALDGSEADNRLIATGDGILCGYATSDDDARRRADIARQHGKPIHGAIRAITPDTMSPDEIQPRVDAWRRAGVESIDIYNYGLMPGTNWNAVANALTGRTS
ncbi:MAG TPA: family 10 glycosylhydrolase [Thermomicrobiales bacterium]|nr:family 10 glycosylhydrolase [Thermomicrobiales bacterium]